MFKLCVEKWGAHLPMYIVEVVIGVIVLFAVETLLFYCCICVGQQAKKNRVLAAVGVYFGIYAVNQVIGTIFVVMATFIDWEPLVLWAFEHPFATVHVAFCGGILLYTLIGALYFVVSHWLMTKRLNLE